MIDLIEQGKAEDAEALWRDHVATGAAVALRHLGPTTIVDLLA